MKSTFIRLGTASTVMAAMALAACGGGGGSPGATSGGGTGTPPPVLGGGSGTLNISLTDAPACGFDAVNVTIKKVRVHQNANAAEADTGWSEVVLSPARKINLLDLTNGKLDRLGSVAVPAGRYSQVSLVIDANAGSGLANSVTPTATKAETTLETPAALQPGVKVSSNVEVVAGQTQDLVLDFDACRSVVGKAGGGYLLTPVITAASSGGNGITGFVNPLVAASGVVVSVQRSGGVIASTVVNPSSGAFAINRLTPGTYDVVFTATDRTAAVVGDVTVASTTASVALSTASAPIAMPPSLTRSISGTITMLPAAPTVKAYVSASQTVANAKTVVIQARDAAPGTGLYSMDALPVAAPLYATYNVSLPLVFNPVNPAQGAGVYRVDAVATGYSNKSVSPVNVLNGNQTNVNLQLTP